MAEQQAKKETGALWKRTSTKTDELGNEVKMNYLAGTMTVAGVAYKIAIFVNKRKETEKHPDFNMVIDKKEG